MGGARESVRQVRGSLQDDEVSFAETDLVAGAKSKAPVESARFGLSEAGALAPPSLVSTPSKVGAGGPPARLHARAVKVSFQGLKDVEALCHSTLNLDWFVGVDEPGEEDEEGLALGASDADRDDDAGAASAALAGPVADVVNNELGRIIQVLERFEHLPRAEVARREQVLRETILALEQATEAHEARTALDRLYSDDVLVALPLDSKILPLAVDRPDERGGTSHDSGELDPRLRPTTDELIG